MCSLSGGDAMSEPKQRTATAETRPRIWDAFLTDQDRLVYVAAGYGRRGGFGTRPALFLIDIHYNFLGDEPLPILEAIKQYRTACGERGWAVVRRLEKLLPTARERRVPIFYTVAERRADLRDGGAYLYKNYRAADGVNVAGTRGTQIVETLTPRPEDHLISKRKPSAFFGTDLMSLLNGLDVDTVVLSGCTTSGCIRATAVDAFSYNFRVAVIEDCTFDRGEASHAMNLFDLNAKYADVVGATDVQEYFRALPASPG